MVVSVQTYERLALEDPEGQWELVCGRPRSKPDMTFAHNDAMHILGFRLQQQLPLDQYRVRVNSGRVRWSTTHAYIPDVMVIPIALTHAQRARPYALEAYSEPLPLVVEVWSPSTGGYDVETKFPEYKRRGDAEIWRMHPYDRTLTTWQQQADGSYHEAVHRGGIVTPVALLGVKIDLDELFA